MESKEKALEELSEEDIHQLTREDCRRYLKLRGMRRPSWNKSQAIQQVISLKSLFDSKSDEDDASQMPSRDPGSTEYKSIQLSRSIDIWCSSCNLAFENIACFGGIVQRSLSKNLNMVERSKDLQPSVINRYPMSALASGPTSQGTMPSMGLKQKAIDDDKSKATKKQSAEQLTIFYKGRVNVYDDITPDKARAIMLLAGSVNSRPSKDAFTTPCNISHASLPLVPSSLPSLVRDKEQPMIATKSEQEPPRKALVQRFLEKRKERLRSKGPYPIGKLVGEVCYLPHNNLLEKLAITNLHKHYQRMAQSSGSEASSSLTKQPPNLRNNCSDEQETDAQERNQENMSFDAEQTSSPS